MDDFATFHTTSIVEVVRYLRDIATVHSCNSLSAVLSVGERLLVLDFSGIFYRASLGNRYWPHITSVTESLNLWRFKGFVCHILGIRPEIASRYRDLEWDERPGCILNCQYNTY